MPAPLSTMLTTTRCALALRADLDAAAVRHGVQRIVDQVRPDLVQFADKAEHARQSGSTSTATATDFARAFDFSTATVLLKPCARSTGSATVA